MNEIVLNANETETAEPQTGSAEPNATAGVAEEAFCEVVPPRFTYENRETIACPLVPIGSKLEGRSEGHDEDGDERISLVFESIDWCIEQPRRDKGLTSAGFYDVFYGLMHLFAEAGFPEDGKVCFSRYSFLQMLGWVSAGTGGSAKKSLPSGRHYKQLRDALHSLVKTVYYKDDAKKSSGFNVLSFYELTDDPPGRKSSGKEMPLNSHVIFNPQYISRILRDPEQMLRIDFNQYLRISAGTPRAMYRALMALKDAGITSLPLDAWFQRMGSIRARALPAISRQTWDRSFEEMVAKGVLASMPTYERSAEEWLIQFVWGEETVAEPEVVSLAVSYGVRITTARDLYAENPARFAEVMAAVKGGRLKATENVAGLIVSYVRTPSYLIPREEKENVREPMPDPVQQAYYAWLSAEIDTRLQERKDLNAAAIRSEIMDASMKSGFGATDQVIDALFQARMTRELNLPTYEEFRSIMTARSGS